MFDRIGTHYFLTEVWRSSDGGMLVPTSEHERS